MKRSNLLSLVFLCLAMPVVLFSGCSKTDDPVDEKCGEPYTWTSQNELFVNSSLDNSGTYREFYIEDLNRPDDICVEEHPTVTFTLGCRGGTTPPADMTVTAKAYWSIYKPVTTPMTYDASLHQFKATMNPGLKDAFPDKPGHINTQIMVKLKSVGGQALDSIRADSFVHSPEMTVKYRVYK